MTVINPKELDSNVFKLFDDSWCLISAYDKDRKEGLKYNAMTASWGGMGVLWNKNVFFCFVRPQRFTREFIDNTDKVTLSFFAEDRKKDLSYCGSHSGRDENKLEKSGFKPSVTDEGHVVYDDALITVKGKKLFCSKMKKEDFADIDIAAKNYAAGDFHYVYVCEIQEIQKA